MLTRIEVEQALDKLADEIDAFTEDDFNKRSLTVSVKFRSFIRLNQYYEKKYGKKWKPSTKPTSGGCATV